MRALGDTVEKALILGRSPQHAIAHTTTPPRGERHESTLLACATPALREFLHTVGVPNGLAAFGYTASDIPDLVAGALPQARSSRC